MNKQNKRAGFTIIELMIAVSVFSTVMLILSYGIINIGRMYYKNLTSSRTQESARGVIEDISGSVQFTGSNIIFRSGNPAVFCSGTDRYVVFVDRQVNTEDPNPALHEHAIWREDTTEGSCPAFSGLNDGKELLNESMLVLGFNVEDLGGGLVDIDLSVAHLPRLQGGEASSTLLDDNNGDGQLDACKPGGANRFCAVSTLDTTVKRRIN